MSDMKCPICGTILDKAFINDKIRGCPKCRNMGNIELWQELIRTKELLDIESAEHEMCHTQMLKTTEKLERTRKALEIAVDALKDCEKILKADRKDWGYLTAKVALNQIEALAEITALEQKDK